MSHSDPPHLKRDDWANQLMESEPKVLRHANKILRDPEEAKDAVYDVIGRFYARGPKESDNSVEALLMASVTHRCYDKLRQDSRHLETSITCDDGATLEIEDHSAMRRFLLEETKESIRWALGKLSLNYRRLVFMRYWEDLKLDEIGRQLGVKPSTVHHHLTKALAQLEKNLKRGGVHVR